MPPDINPGLAPEIRVMKLPSKINSRLTIKEKAVAIYNKGVTWDQEATREAPLVIARRKILLHIGIKNLNEPKSEQTLALWLMFTLWVIIRWRCYNRVDKVITELRTSDQECEID